MLDVRRLRLLRAFSVHGTVAATAEALHLTGPAVSQQLAALERETGVPVLEKRGRTLRLTPAGRLLVEHAEVILGDLASAEAALDRLRGGAGGPVRVAAFPSAARTLMPEVWRLLAGGDAGASTGLRIAEHEPAAAVELLRRREADIAVVHAYSLLPREVPAGCEQHHLMEDPVLLAVPPALAAEHGLGPGEALDLALLAGQEWLMPGPDTSCHELTRRACGAAGFVPRPVALASDFSVLTALVAAGAGVALVPRLALPAALDGVSLHPPAHPVTRTVSALLAAGTAGQPPLRRVLECLVAAAGRHA
ncbi:LysR substrate-binding domain-containing protein [Streptomyces sp. PA03-1a]|nr:LysR substrate-binding domain-containing protein [Streptomyces sp. PA03-1a]MDX2813308.1 LysR substrate-binding domain-containing protein [Streptomyces sp. PA03-5A]